MPKLPPLEQLYLELLKTPIPKQSKIQKTFFDIGSFGHRENIISNFYAYFLDQKETHGLKDIFLQTLLDLIYDKRYFPIDWSNWEVRREVSIKMGSGKIDLWIEAVEEEKKVIIIENKIYHQVYNNLKGYLNAVEVDYPINKIGVLLTVKPEKKIETGFINITHTQWIQAIKQKVQQSKLALSDRQKLIFNDFCKNFDTHVKHSKAMMERHLFYLKHRKAIHQLFELRKEFRSDCLNAIRNVADDFGFDVKDGQRLNSNSPYIDISLETKPKLVLRFRVQDDVTKKELITAKLRFDSTYYKKKAEPLFKKRSLFTNYQGMKILKATEEMKYELPSSLTIAYKHYTLDNLKKDSLETFVTDILDNEWIPYRDAVLKKY